MIFVLSQLLADPAGTVCKRQEKEMFTIADIHNTSIQIERNKEEMGRTLAQDMYQGNTFLLDRKDLDAAETAMEVFAISKEFAQDTIVYC